MSDHNDKKAEFEKRKRNYMNMLIFPGFVAGIANYNEQNEQEEYTNETEDQESVQPDAPAESVMDSR